MHTVIVRRGRKLISKQTFKTEDAAWIFLEKHEDMGYTCEYINQEALAWFNR